MMNVGRKHTGSGAGQCLSGTIHIMYGTIQLPVKRDETLHIVQFTDTHIFADQRQRFDGIDTAASLKQVLEYARTGDWPPDLVLVTGDLVHDPVPEAYERFCALLCDIPAPVCCLPGNHDDPGYMETMLNLGSIGTTKKITGGNWLILLLNTFKPGSHGGHLPETELEWLDAKLNFVVDTGEHVLICLHHQPVSIASPWMDTMALDNPDALFAILDRYPQVKGILWGHIHQEFTGIRRGVALYGSPSTCIQFLPQTEQSRIADLAPACRWLKLAPDGGISSHVDYVDTYIPGAYADKR